MDTAMMSAVRSLLVLLMPTVAPAFAQAPWPQKQVRMIVPRTAGGSAHALGQGAAPQGQSAAADAFMKEQEAHWRAVIESANVTLQ
jgi:tripartite-type tricarboxylate transporter receptor subunit TctC